MLQSVVADFNSTKNKDKLPVVIYIHHKCKLFYKILLDGSEKKQKAVAKFE